MASKYLSKLLLLAALIPLSTSALSNCPLLGPDFPPPKNLSSSSTVQSAIGNLSQILSNTLLTDNSSYGLFNSSNAYALEVFSTHSPDLIFSNYSNAEFQASSQQGTKNVNTDTAFRVGSFTKLLTVYTFLIYAGDVQFNEPITKYIPELAAAAQSRNASQDHIDAVAWEDITIGALASQSAGIGRDYAGFGELDGPFNTLANPTSDGLPPLNSSELPVCAGGSFCTRAEFFEGFTKRHPVYAPSTAAVYSNVAYQILAYALENITNTSFPELVQEGLFNPLELTGSSWQNPPADNATSLIVPGSSWGLDLGDETPAGGAYLTPANATSLGRSILKSSLLKPTLTQRWMKPRTFISDPLYAIGAPWEIHRLQIGPNARLVDTYTKAGDLPGYSSLLVLVPDFDVGFTIMVGGSSTDATVGVLASTIADTLMPAIEAAAREEADTALSGRYCSSEPSLNSSITLSTDSSKPGLGVVEYISNGTNLLTSLAAIEADISATSIRLYPTGLKKQLHNGDTVMSFRAVFENLSSATITGPFGFTCDTWELVDAMYWGTVAADEFLIMVGRDGKGKSITPRALRNVLLKDN